MIEPVHSILFSKTVQLNTTIGDLLIGQGNTGLYALCIAYPIFLPVRLQKHREKGVKVRITGLAVTDPMFLNSVVVLRNILFENSSNFRFLRFHSTFGSTYCDTGLNSYIHYLRYSLSDCFARTMSESSQEHVAVAVRVRPLNGSEVCILHNCLICRKVAVIEYAGIVSRNITTSIRWMRMAV